MVKQMGAEGGRDLEKPLERTTEVNRAVLEGCFGVER